MKKLFTLLLLTCCFYCTNIQAQCNMQASFTKTNSSCEANGTVTIKVTDPSDFEDISGGLFAKTGSSYPSGYQLGVTFLQNIPPGIYDVKVRAKCKITGITEAWELGEVKITSTYIVPNMYVYTANIVNSLKYTNSGRIPFVFNDGKAPYTVTMKNHPASYTGPTTFTLDKIQASQQQGILTIKDLPPGNYTFSLKDDCGTNTADMDAVIKEFDMPLIKHEYYGDSLHFDIFQLDENKKIGLRIGTWNNHQDLSHHFPYYYGSGSPGSYQIQYTETYWGGDTTKQLYNSGWGYYEYDNIDTINIGITPFEIALIENNNTANKIMGKWVKNQTYYQYYDYGNGHYQLQVYWEPYYEIELKTLKFKDLYGNLGATNDPNASGNLSPIGFMLRYPGASQWYSKVNPLRTRRPYGAFMFDNTNCTVGGDLYVSISQGAYSYYRPPGYNYSDSYHYVISYPVTVEVYNESNAKIISKVIPYVPLTDYSNQKSPLWRFYSQTKDTLIGNLPYGKYFIKFKDADGGIYDTYYHTNHYNNAYHNQDKDTIRYTDYKYKIKYQQAATCRDEGTTGSAYISSNNINNYWMNYYWGQTNSSGYEWNFNNGWWQSNAKNKYSQFYPGTIIRYKSGPQLPVPADIVIPANRKHQMISLFTDPWAGYDNNGNFSYNRIEAQAKIIAGKHIFEVIPPAGCGPVQEVEFTMPQIHASYSASASNSACHTLETLGKIQAWIRPAYDSPYGYRFPIGTKIECIQHPGTPPLHSSVITSSTISNFYPFALDYTGVGGAFASVPAGGVYKFRITDGACGEVVEVQMTIPSGYEIRQNLDYTAVADCMGDKIYPTGSIGYYQNSYWYDNTVFWIHKLVLENGSVSTSGLDYSPTSSISQGQYTV